MIAHKSPTISALGNFIIQIHIRADFIYIFYWNGRQIEHMLKIVSMKWIALSFIAKLRGAKTTKTECRHHSIHSLWADIIWKN